jgi:catechol 2,3-dioxygenase-like lactoylglutathione lyase family enzyme
MELHNVTVVRHTAGFEAMSRFYGELLGMSTVEEWDRPDGRGAVFAPAGSAQGAHIEVLDMPGATVPGTPPVNVVLSVFVADVQAVHDGLVSAGAVIARGVEDTSWGHRSFGLDDPDGLRIWVVQDLVES